MLRYTGSLPSRPKPPIAVPISLTWVGICLVRLCEYRIEFNNKTCYLCPLAAFDFVMLWLDASHLYLFYWWSMVPYLMADSPSVIRSEGWSREGPLHGHELG